MFVICLVLLIAGAGKAFAQVTRPGILLLEQTGSDVQIIITNAQPFWPFVLMRTENIDAGTNTLWTVINTNQTNGAGFGWLYTDTNAVPLHERRFYRTYAFGTGTPPNTSPKPTLTKLTTLLRRGSVLER